MILKPDLRPVVLKVLLAIALTFVTAFVVSNPLYAGTGKEAASSRKGLKAALEKARLPLGMGHRYFRALDGFYRGRSYRPVWTGARGFSANGKIVLKLLRHVSEDGLDPKDYPLPDISARHPGVLDDIKLSFSLVRYGEQVRAGRVSPDKIVAEHDLKANHPDLVKLLKDVTGGKDPASLLQKLAPPHKQYQLLKKQLKKLRARQALQGRQPAQMEWSLQRADFRKLRKEENLIIANMERWRWVPRDLGRRHVWINLPSFKVLVRNEGKTEFSTDGVIGRRDAPTPLISSRIKNIIVNPFWHIPASVVARDILPRLKKNAVAYLQEQSIKILRRGGRLVDPAKVNWAKIVNPRTFRFRQSPGKKNALGRMKILFPNSHAIYLHDTNEPELFLRKSRAFSHGCVRLADPVGFADMIAGFDRHLVSQMPGTLIGKREHWLKYKAEMPVHLVYFTAVIDRKGKLVTLPDVYHYDEKIIQAFAGVPQNT